MDHKDLKVMRMMNQIDHYAHILQFFLSKIMQGLNFTVVTFIIFNLWLKYPNTINLKISLYGSAPIAEY